MKLLAPHADTAYCVSAYRISDFQTLDEYIPFFERTIRKLVHFVDILLIVRISKHLREEDRRFVQALLERRAHAGRPTIVDGHSSSVEYDAYEKILEVKE
jgi:hypothetical protein